MVEPTGYTALDLIGFTDRGPYDPDANYVKNDLVHVGNSTWRCKIDDTTGITPTEGANWTIFIESATSLAGMSDVDLNTPKAGDGLVHDGNDWTNIPIMTKELEIKTGAHNLLRFPTLAELQALNTSGSWSGNLYTFGNVTYAIDVANETITVNCNGTGGNNTKYLALYNRLSKRYYVDNGDYKVNGVDSGVDGKFQITVSATTTGATSQAWEVKGIDKEGASFTYNSSQVDGLGVSINVNENYAVNNVVVKPMIRYAIDKTTDHAPCAKSNRQLTEDTNVKEIAPSNLSSANARISLETSDNIVIRKIGRLVVIEKLGIVISAGADIPYNVGVLITGLPAPDSAKCVLMATGNAHVDFKSVGFTVNANGSLIPASFNNIPANANNQSAYFIGGACYIAKE